MYSHCHLEKKESKRVLANRMTIGTSIGSRMSQHVRKPSLVLIKANIPSFLMLLHTNLKSIIKIILFRVYFRISLKRGQMHCGKFQEGSNPNSKGGNPILNTGKANCQGGHKSIPRGGESTPSLPPEINPTFANLYVCIIVGERT